MANYKGGRHNHSMFASTVPRFPKSKSWHENWELSLEVRSGAGHPHKWCWPLPQTTVVATHTHSHTPRPAPHPRANEPTKKPPTASSNPWGGGTTGQEEDRRPLGRRRAGLVRRRGPQPADAAQPVRRGPRARARACLGRVPRARAEGRLPRQLGHGQRERLRPAQLARPVTPRAVFHMPAQWMWGVGISACRG